MEKIIKKIADSIKSTPYENITYVVGGFVRDKVMGVISNDLDIVVERQEGGIKLANYLHQKGISSKPVIFPRFSTAQIIVDSHKIEFVMTRKESYQSNSRKPEVDHATIKEDVLRRDFTINTLLMNISTGEILDLTGQARKDINKKLIRSTSNPDEIFAEDPLRMLRAVRFAVQLDFRIATSTREGIIRNAGILSSISRERQRDEMENILLSPDPARGIKLLSKFNLIETIIPELKFNSRLNAVLDVIGNSKRDLPIRLSILLINNDLAEVNNILRRLKFSNQQIKTAKLLIKNFRVMRERIKRKHIFSDAELRKLIYENENQLKAIVNILNTFFTNGISLQDYAEDFNKIKARLLELKTEFAKTFFPVDGEDIKSIFNISSGPQVGRLLEQAKNIWFKYPNLGKDEILGNLKDKQDLS